MAVDIQKVFLTSQDLSLKNQGGYYSNDEFNRGAQLANEWLFSFWAARYAESSEMPEAMRVFIKQQVLPPPISTGALAGAVPLPADYRFMLEVGLRETVNSSCGEEPKIRDTPCRFRLDHQNLASRRSTLRSGNLALGRAYYSFVGTNIVVDPVQGFHSVIVQYFRTPAAPVRQVTLDSVNKIETYNPTGTIHFEWPEIEFDNLVDLILFQKSIQIRDSDLMTWVMARKQAQPT